MEDWKLLDEFNDGRQKGIGDGLVGGGFFLEDLVQKELKAVLEVRQRHARPADLPRVVAQVAANQLAQDRMQKQKTLNNIGKGALDMF
jgi:hypothetical protein